MTRHACTALIAALVVSAGCTAASAEGRSAAPREVKIIARDMAFHVEGQPGTNPVLKFKAGEEVTITLVNEDEGMRHNFRIPAWEAGTRLVRGKGEISATFKVPDTKQETKYVCLPHQARMNGKVIVE